MSGNDDSQQSEPAEPAPKAGPDSGLASAALALNRTRGGKASEPLDDFLRKQAELTDAQRQLVGLQMEHLHEERELHHRHAALKYLGDRLRIGLQLLAIALGLFLVVGLAVMAWQAHADHSLVVEAFSVPPDLAARGASGQALAEDLMSRVAAIRSVANSGSLTHSGDVRADQADALKLDIPETGVSIGELDRFLHRWLGHETLLTGEARDEADGNISIRLHITGADPIAVTGPARDLDGLMQQTAEKAFATFDPGNYVIYLAESDRGPEAFAAAQKSALAIGAGGRPSIERADVYALWANSDPDRRRALAHALIAIDIDPRSMVAWLEARNASLALGHDQAAVDFARRLLKTRIDDQLPAQRYGYAETMAYGRATIDDSLGDFAALAADYRASPASVIDHYAQSARADAARHDTVRSATELARALAAGPLDEDVQRARWYVRSAAGDWPQAAIAAKALVDDAEAAKAKVAGSEQAGQVELRLQTLYRPWLAEAEAMTGDVMGAKALIAASPPDCYLCVRVRARIAAMSGDATGADRAFAEAVRQAPNLPKAYLEWGQVLLARGDLAGAAAKFDLASQKGPRFADPLKDWGDVLARQGQWKAALAKYHEALKFAPGWEDLRRARAAAANHAGAA